MSFNKGQVIRFKNTPSQKYDVVRVNPFGIQGAILVKAQNGPKHSAGEMHIIVPHTPGMKDHEYKLDKFENDA